MAVENLVHRTKVYKKGFSAESTLKDTEVRTLFLTTCEESTPPHLTLMKQTTFVPFAAIP